MSIWSPPAEPSSKLAASLKVNVVLAPLRVGSSAERVRKRKLKWTRRAAKQDFQLTGNVMP